MSLDDIVEFYKNNITSFGLVFRHFKLMYYGFIVFFCVSIIMLLVFIMSLSLKLHVLWKFAIFICAIGITALFLIRLNLYAREKVHRDYGLAPKFFIWRTKEFEELQFNRLKDYLLENGLYNEKKLIQLVNLLYKEADRRKVPSFIAPSVFLAFLVPVWIQVIGVLYKQVTTLPIAISYMLTLVVVMLVAITLFGQIKNIYIEVKETFFLEEIKLMKRLALFLEEIMLGIPCETNVVEANIE